MCNKRVYVTYTVEDVVVFVEAGLVWKIIVNYILKLIMIKLNIS